MYIHTSFIKHKKSLKNVFSQQNCKSFLPITPFLFSARSLSAILQIMKLYYKNKKAILRKGMAILLALLCLGQTLGGCAAPGEVSASTNHAAGKACTAFFENILNAYLAEGEEKQSFYAEAFDLVSDDVKYADTQPAIPAITASPDGSVQAVPAATAEPIADENKINYTAFRDKYENIFAAIGMEAFAVQVTNVSATLNSASVDFQLTYQTSEGGILNYPECTMQLQRQGTRWHILWAPSLIFPVMDWGDTVLQGVLQPQRGEIFAADGQLLAKNTPAVTIFCVPSKIPLGDGYKAKFDVKPLFKKEDEELTEEEAAEKSLYADFWNAVAMIPELKVDAEDVRNALARTYQDMAKIATLYPDQLTSDLEARLTNIPGIAWDTGNFGTVREYPFGELFGHFTGYAGIIQYEYLHEYDKFGNPSDKWKNDPFYDGDSWLGYAGLEEQYESILRGEKGSFAYIQGANGKNKETLFITPAKDGEDLHLTLQPYLQARLKEVYETIVQPDVTGINAALIMMNPKTGAIEAMYSSPGYDPNKFARGEYTEETWAQMLADIKNPLINRNIQGLFPPGSTFKTVTAAIALESGTVTKDDVFPDSEKIVIGSRSDIWYPTYRGGLFAYTGVAQVARTGTSNRHKPMNLTSSIIDSDNIYFSWLALKMGWDTFRWYLEKNGMNESIPFDMAVSSAQIKNAESESSYDLLAMTGYGQGELLITPLQMACYTAAFANEGNVPIPYLIAERWQAEGTEYTQTYEHSTGTWKRIASAEDAADIANAMWGVCRSRYNRGYDRGGTGMNLGVNSFEIAGKTGTAEIGKSKAGEHATKELAWFIGYRYSMPLADGGGLVAEEDERLVLVMLELDMENLPAEATMFKFNIAQALLKSDDLTREPQSENIIKESTTTEDP